MKTTFLKSETNFGCYSISQADSFLPESSFTISDVLNASVPLKDKAWFIRNNCQFTQDQYREFAIGCALCVLPIYETKYPENKAPREAIEAAKAYLKKEIGLDELIIKRRDADATYADAYAAAAAAAYAATYADAYAAAAAAAYAATYADAYAAYAKEISYTYLLLQFFIEFTKE